jgi:hypothetical protein
MIGFIIGGSILIAIGLGMILYKKKVEDKILNVKYHDKTDIKSVLEMCLSVGSEVGKGHFTKMVKITGKSGIDRPLIGEFSGKECVYYEVQVDHTFDKLEESKDSNGRTQQKWVNRSETLGSEKKGGEFWLIDNSGRINLNIEGSNLSLPNAIHNKKSALRAVDFSFTQYHPVNNRDMRSTGYIEIERHLKVGENLFIVGELHDRDGEPKISKPSDKKETFVVSTKSEEEVIKGFESQVKMLFYGGIALAVIGAIVIVSGFFQ